MGKENVPQNGEDILESAFPVRCLDSGPVDGGGVGVGESGGLDSGGDDGGHSE